MDEICVDVVGLEICEGCLDFPFSSGNSAPGRAAYMGLESVGGERERKREKERERDRGGGRGRGRERDSVCVCARARELQGVAEADPKRQTVSLKP